MPREAEPSNLERTFILEALGQNIRVDGRAFDQFRPIDLTFGEDYGAATVSLGKTRCLHPLPRAYLYSRTSGSMFRFLRRLPSRSETANSMAFSRLPRSSVR